MLLNLSHPSGHLLPPGPVDRYIKASDLGRAKDHLPSIRQTLKVPPGSRPKEEKALAPRSRLVPDSLGLSA